VSLDLEAGLDYIVTGFVFYTELYPCLHWEADMDLGSGVAGGLP
jgi:hypothetical protein